LDIQCEQNDCFNHIQLHASTMNESTTQCCTKTLFYFSELAAYDG